MSKFDEPVLCISAEKLFAKGKWQGFKMDNLEYYWDLLSKEAEFKIRGPLEEDPSYKQIIPQVILRYNNKYFLHRQVSANEARLDNLCPLPLGGHVEPFDVVEGANVLDVALDRELHEEADVKANIIAKEFVGIVYVEDENLVNHMHIGLMYIFDLDGDDVKMHYEGLETIGWMDAEYLRKNIDTLTYWSRYFVREKLGK